jgi:hypothetical protein
MILQVLVGGAAWTTAASVGFLYVATKAPAESGHVEVVLDHGVAGGRVFKASAAFCRTAGNADEVHTDFEDATHEPLGVIGVVERVWAAERSAENLHVAKAHFPAFPHAFEGVALPATAGIGGVADAVLLLLRVDGKLADGLVGTGCGLCAHRGNGTGRNQGCASG